MNDGVTKGGQPWHFKPGYDPRREGNGRKPGVPQKPRMTKEQRLAQEAVAKGAELAQQALDRMRAEIELMDERSLAQFAAKPALRLLLDIVEDVNIKLELRMQAARDLLSTGWAKAPTANLNLSGDITMMSDQALAALLLPSQGTSNTAIPQGEPPQLLRRTEVPAEDRAPDED